MKKARLIRAVILITVLGGLVLTACSVTQPDIQLESRQVDLGEVVEGEIVTREVRLSNEGGAPLEIISISTSCGCTEASLESTLISPGESVPLMITYDSGAHAVDADVSVHRQIFIASNDPSRPEVIIDLMVDVLNNSGE